MAADTSGNATDPSMSASSLDTCSTWLAFPPPSVPPPPSSGSVGWLFLGIVMCLAAVGLLTLGTNVQRYGLTVVADKGCCGRRGSCIANGVWFFGWIIYASGNGVYTFAVTLAPATLCSALLGTAVVWNALISRMLLGERLAACDLQGGTLILAGIALTQIFGPTDSVEYTAPQFLALLDDPGGVAYLVCMVLLIVSLAALVVCHERRERRYGDAPSASGVQLSAGAGAASDGAASGCSGGGASAPGAPRSAGTLLSILAPFAYPIVVGSIESLQQLCLIAVSRMFYRSLDGESQFCFATFWVVLTLLVVMILGQVWWLRKALLNLEVTRVLPIEYGTVASLSILGSIIFFQEGLFIPPNYGFAIAVGILLIAVGCAQVGSRSSPWPRCFGLFHGPEVLPKGSDAPEQTFAAHL